MTKVLSITDPPHQSSLFQHLLPDVFPFTQDGLTERLTLQPVSLKSHSQLYLYEVISPSILQILQSTACGGEVLACHVPGDHLNRDEWQHLIPHLIPYLILLG